MTKIKNVIRGDKCVLTVTVTDADGAPVDLSGYIAFVTIKKALNKTSNTNDDNTAALQVRINPITQLSTGVFEVTLTGAQTTTLLPATYVYDVQLVDPTGQPYSTQEDEFVVIADVTRSMV